MRNWGIGLVAVAIWLLCFYGQGRPPALGRNAPASAFSVARADTVLARILGQQRPHPAGSPEDEAVHARVQAEFARLDVKTGTLSTVSCYGEARWRATTCAQVTDIIGEVAPGSGPAIVLMAHMDSVAAGPGAGDDESDVAIIMETIRAWKARGLTTEHPILALITDGEENAMLGASAFLHDPNWRAKTGVVINLESRGNQGRSFLFQTSPGDGALVELYARSVPHPATSSLYAEIYKILPNDTDLTPFLQAGFTGYNFSFIGNVAAYHTPRDRQENLDTQALQQQGESALGLVTALAATDFTSLKSGDGIYFDVLGRWLPQIPKNLALPLSLFSFLGMAVAGWWRSRSVRSLSRRRLGFVMPPLLLLGVIAAGFLLHEIAILISGYPDPSFAHPWAFRLALFFGVWTVALWATRLGAGAIASWVWLSGLGVVTALLLPGLSPYFLFPSLVAVILLLATARMPDGAWRLAAWIGALACAVTWLDLAASGEAIMGLAAHPLFTVSAGFALIALMPLMNRKGAGFSALASACLALLFAVIAGFLPPFSHASPQRLNLHYVEEGGHGEWIADPVKHLPESLTHAGHFSQITTLPLFGRGYLGEAGAAENAPPGATASRNSDHLTITLHGSSQADGMMLILPSALMLESVNGRQFANLPPSTRLTCDTPDCATATVIFAGKSPAAFDVVEVRRGLPAKGKALLEARPDNAVPSGGGDETFLVRHVAIPSG
ncbi:MAG TPA: M20/M25/M40 family metallo-hydrolase [Rhizomicrobium sp.]|nr:M20/M25/M40 family metallo-hydrolase [Rhizomicrobium sp.]